MLPFSMEKFITELEEAMAHFDEPEYFDISKTCSVVYHRFLDLDLSAKAYTEISGGERQMVLFAHVMAQQPKIFLLDEPTAHLDFGNQIQVLTLIKRMAETGMLVIITSHAPDHAFMTAKTVALMTEEDIRMGPPDTILIEKRLQAVYGVDICILVNGRGGKTCIPLMP